MLTFLEAFGIQPAALQFRLAAASSAVAGTSVPEGGISANDMFQLRDVTGIGPVSSTINSIPLAKRGEFFTGSSVGKRNIVLKIGLNPDWADQTMAGLRQLLYQYFMTESEVKLRFHSTHLPTCEIDGYVENLEPNIFSRDPEVLVSIICPEPDFVATEVTELTGLVLAGGEDVDTIEYVGTVEAGIDLRVIGNDETPTYSADLDVVTGTAEEQFFRLWGLDISETLILHMSSIPGNKFVRKHLVDTEEGAVSLLQNIGDGSLWPVLKRGTNFFGVFTNLDDDPGQDWILRYFARFGGL